MSIYVKIIGVFFIYKIIKLYIAMGFVKFKLIT